MQWSFAQLVAADLPAGLWELVDEDDLARNLPVRQGLRDELTKLGLELLRASVGCPRYDERADEVAASLEVPNADDRSRGDRRVAVEDALDVVRAECAAAARDDVLGATDEREVALLVDVRDVAGQVPVAEECGFRLLRKLPVAGEQGRRSSAYGEVSLDAGGKLVALVVDHRDVMARERAAERARLHRAVGEICDDDIRLGLAVAVRDRHAPALLEDSDDLRVEEVAGRHEPSESR